MPDDFASLQLVAWRVEIGTPDPRNPLLEPAMPWDSGGIMAHGTVLRDPIDGLWKAWQVSTPGEEKLDGLKAVHEHQRRLTYLESKDGVKWYRPELPFVRRRLLAGETVIGSWINSGSPIVAEMMAICGFDFLCVDVEHSAVDLPQAQQLLQAIKSGRAGCAAVVRLHGIDYAFAKRYLDAGAAGVVAPLVRTREEAELLVQPVRYPPQGMRGVGYCRANAYGLRVADEFARANDDILLAVQIEHIDAVRNIDAILQVPGVDVAFIGPYDLSASMGIAADFEHPDYLAARAAILAACQRHSVVPGIHVVPPAPAEVRLRIAEGYRFIGYSLDLTMLATASAAGLAALLPAAQFS